MWHSLLAKLLVTPQTCRPYVWDWLDWNHGVWDGLNGSFVRMNYFRNGKILAIVFLIDTMIRTYHDCGCYARSTHTHSDKIVRFSWKINYFCSPHRSLILYTVLYSYLTYNRIINNFVKHERLLQWWNWNKKIFSQQFGFELTFTISGIRGLLLRKTKSPLNRREDITFAPQERRPRTSIGPC